MGRTMSSSSSSSFSSLLPFFLLLGVISLFIGANGKTEPESGMDYTSAFVTQKKDDMNLPNDSPKRVTSPNGNDEGDDDGDTDDEEEEEEDEEDASGDGEVEEGEEEEEEVEGEYEGEERDEYEDELKALAESHEAMSKDETKDEGKSSNASSKANPLPKSESSDAKNFESQENVLEKQSDEDEASNEAIIDELPSKHEDKEVADLLKYKKGKNSRKMEDEELSKKKKKRVPTVKKELSTQKEIILANNETQVPKSLVPSEETFNVLNEDTEPVQRRDLERDERSQGEQTQEKISESEKKYDKKNNVVPWQLKPCKTKSCEMVIEGKESLSEEKVPETKDSANLQKRYHEELGRWVGIRDRFPTDSQTGLEEKDYEVNSLRQLTMDDTQKEGKKLKKKKKKKKKKKLQQRRSTTTTELSMSPSTTIRPTTEADTETTTGVQWHLLAEKWFGLSLPQDDHPQSENVAKIQYSVTSKPNSFSSSIQRLVDQQDTTNDEKESNTARPPSLLSSKEQNLDGRSNLYPFGKTNDHRNVFNLGAERLTDYETPERAFQRLRFGELAATSPRDFSLREKNLDDYRDDGGPFDEDFVHNREYRPPSQDFGMSRNWPDIPPKYNRPWKGETRPIPSRLSNDWAWRQPPPPLPPRYDVDYWPPRGNNWQPIRNYWTALDNEEADEPEIGRSWRARDPQQRWRRPRPPMRQRQRQRLRQRLRQENEEEDDERLPYSPWDLEGPDVWPMPAKPFQLESPWPRFKDHIYESVKPATAATSTTTSMGRLNGKSKVSLPKISMTTWNSLTSDPATWPYKSSDTRPWPKDENGKSYNPNADLVRKLGLDKSEATIWSTEKIGKLYNAASDRRNSLEANVRNSSKDDGETLTRKFKLPKDRTNFGIYDLRSQSAKLWGKQRNGEAVPSLESSNDDVNGWYRYEPPNPYDNINEDDSWPRRPMNVDVWDRNDGLLRMDANLADPWTGRFGNDRWNKENYAQWDRKRSFDKGQPEDVDAVKTNRVDTFVLSKTNQTNVENPKDDQSLSKLNNWNASYEGSSPWPLRWKQFSYHRVTALPTSKPGTITNSSSKSRNAYVAVSVVSSPKYLPSRNDIEDSANNKNDHFEKQLEDLRRQSFWSSKTNNVEEPIRSTSSTIESTTVEPRLTTTANSTFVAHHPEEELPKSATKKYEMHLRI